MSDIGNYFSQQDKIRQLEERIDHLQKQVEVQRTLKYKAIASRDKAMMGNVSRLNMILGLIMSGKLELTTREISELCFVTMKSVRSARYLLKKKMKKEKQ